MIAKISTGSYTFGMVNYNHNKTKNETKGEKEAILLGTKNIIQDEFKTIVSTITDYNSKNSNVQKPNIHISLNFHKEDILSNEAISEIAQDYMKQMGYESQPYALYRHFDKEHPHVHIVSSQINSEGKKISDSNIYYRSQKLTRDLEDKYGITKAVEKNEIFSKKDIHLAIHEHLEHGKHSLLAIMKRVLTDIMEQKPTSDIQFERLLEGYQMKRIISYDEQKQIKGHFFDLYALEHLNDEKKTHQVSNGIEGNELDSLFTYQSITAQIENNSKEKNTLKKPIMGKIYSVINPVIDNYKMDVLEQQEAIRRIKLSNLIVELKKKGIELLVKRTQTGENINSIYGLLFKDIKSGHTYSASEIKLKTVDFLKAVDDDLRNISEKNRVAIFDEIEEKDSNPFLEENEKREEKISGIFEICAQLLKSHTGTIEDGKALKKRKRRRRRN